LLGKTTEIRVKDVKSGNYAPVSRGAANGADETIDR
jgi:hypothetical protein